MSEHERGKLEDLVERPDIPGKGFVTLAIPEGGSFTIFPERADNSSNCEIRYRVPKDPGIELYPKDKISLPPEERERRRQMVCGGELGRVWSHNLAIQLLNALRKEDFTLLPETQLSQAGFEGGGHNWSKATRGGYFTLSLREECCLLTYERNGANHWHNLMMLNFYHPWSDNLHVSPIFWPDTVSDPVRAAVGLGIKLSTLWTPDLIPKTEKKRKPR